jgi:hypothetical protein
MSNKIWFWKVQTHKTTLGYNKVCIFWRVEEKFKKFKYFWVTFIAAVVKQFTLKWICSHLCFRQKFKYKILQLGRVASSVLFLALCSLTYNSNKQF